MNFSEFKSCIDKLESHFGANSFTGFRRNKLWDAMKAQDYTLLDRAVDRMVLKLVKPPSYETAMKFVHAQKLWDQEVSRVKKVNIQQGENATRILSRVENQSSQTYSCSYCRGSGWVTNPKEEDLDRALKRCDCMGGYQALVALYSSKEGKTYQPALADDIRKSQLWKDKVSSRAWLGNDFAHDPENEPFPDTPEEDTKFLMSFINARIRNQIFDNEYYASGVIK